MIQDQSVLQNVRAEWAFVRRAQNMMALGHNASIVGGFPTTEDFKNASYSLCLLFAFSVLERVLIQLRDEGMFNCTSGQVGTLMAASRSNLAWVNFALVDEAREARNKVAHHYRWPERRDCWRYLDAIEAELKAWQII